ncbi:uncharacterized protein VP01_466g2, partial [Puccinia sorghi]
MGTELCIMCVEEKLTVNQNERVEFLKDQFSRYADQPDHSLSHVLTYTLGEPPDLLHYKSSKHRKYGLLQPLPIPPLPWHSLSMDFISQLPLSNGYDAILVVVDRFSKMSLFIQTKTTCNSSELADLFIEHVFLKHGLPDNIVSDCGS